MNVPSVAWNEMEYRTAANSNPRSSGVARRFASFKAGMNRYQMKSPKTTRPTMPMSCRTRTSVLPIHAVCSTSDQPISLYVESNWKLAVPLPRIGCSRMLSNATAMVTTRTVVLESAETSDTSSVLNRSLYKETSAGARTSVTTSSVAATRVSICAVTIFFFQ